MGLVRRFVADRKGNIATMAALAAPLVLGGAAMGTEVSYWLTQKSMLRGATDGAAITAANLFQRRATQSVIDDAVRQSL